MAQYIDKSALVAEIKRKLEFVEKRLERNNSYTEEGNIVWRKDKALYDNYNSILSIIDTLEVKEVDLENYNKVKKLLSLSFMHFLDITRPEDKMCLSNGECFDIEKAFDELDFAKLFRYMEKYSKTQKGE